MNLYGDKININLFTHLEGDDSFLSKGIRYMFLIIFVCKIPYIFFPGKLALFNIIYEFRTKTISNSMSVSVMHNHSQHHIDDNSFGRRPSDDLDGLRQEKSVTIDFEYNAQIDPMQEVGDGTYYFTVFAYLGFIVIGALVCNDLGLVLGICAGVYESLMDFIFPGLFTLYALRYARKSILSCLGQFCIMWIFGGMGFFVVSNYFNF